jgi:hypothetical protein
MNNATEYTPGQYAIITVPLHGPEGEHLSLGVGAEIIAPGLAITPEVAADQGGKVHFTGGWLLTHIPSGHNVNGTSQGGQCVTCVQEYADVAAGTGINWTLPMADITAYIKAGSEDVTRLKKAQGDLFACGGTDCREVDGF